MRKVPQSQTITDLHEKVPQFKSHRVLWPWRIFVHPLVPRGAVSAREPITNSKLRQDGSSFHLSHGCFSLYPSLVSLCAARSAARAVVPRPVVPAREPRLVLFTAPGQCAPLSGTMGGIGERLVAIGLHEEYHCECSEISRNSTEELRKICYMFPLNPDSFLWAVPL